MFFIFLSKAEYRIPTHRLLDGRERVHINFLQHICRSYAVFYRIAEEEEHLEFSLDIAHSSVPFTAMYIYYQLYCCA